MGSDQRPNNLRFADDVLLVAKKRPHLVKLLEDLQQEALRYGLELHPDKTKILTNCTHKTGRDSCTSVNVNNMDIEIHPKISVLTQDLPNGDRNVSRNEPPHPRAPNNTNSC